MASIRVAYALTRMSVFVASCIHRFIHETSDILLEPHQIPRIGPTGRPRCTISLATRHPDDNVLRVGYGSGVKLKEIQQILSKVSYEKFYKLRYSNSMSEYGLISYGQEV